MYIISNRKYRNKQILSRYTLILGGLILYVLLLDYFVSFYSFIRVDEYRRNLLMNVHLYLNIWFIFRQSIDHFMYKNIHWADNYSTSWR